MPVAFGGVSVVGWDSFGICIEGNMIKQVIVMRKDLNMRKGKMIAQGAHASMKAILDQGTFTNPSSNCPYDRFRIFLTPDLKEWLQGIFTKICVSVDSLDELEAIAEKARLTNIPYAVITDCGLTEFNNIPTKTCCAIGPADSELIDSITGHLKLL